MRILDHDGQKRIQYLDYEYNKNHVGKFEAFAFSATTKEMGCNTIMGILCPERTRQIR